MVGLDSGDLLVMGGNNDLMFQSNAIYRLSANVWSYVGELQTPMFKQAAPLKIGKILYLAGGTSTTTDNPILKITLDDNEEIQSQEEIENFGSQNRVALFAPTYGSCT